MHAPHSLTRTGSFGAVESVKAASDVYAPVAGEVAEVNSALSNDWAAVNNSPYEKARLPTSMLCSPQWFLTPLAQGWMIKLKNFNTKDLDKLLDSKGYLKELENAKH
jgi:glycine cleavage system H protein